jgi:propanol-preferring alcohol dehydrogenase
MLAERGATLPRAIGHEILGRVAKLGPEAEGVQVGDRRIVYPWIGCGHCRRCRVGDDNLCPNQRSLGVMQDGGFGSHVLVPHPRYLVDPGDVDPAVAAIFGCSGITVLGAIRKAMPFEPDDPIALVGAGGLGLAAIGWLTDLSGMMIGCSGMGSVTVATMAAEDFSDSVLRRPIRCGQARRSHVPG